MHKYLARYGVLLCVQGACVACCKPRDNSMMDACLSAPRQNVSSKCGLQRRRGREVLCGLRRRLVLIIKSGGNHPNKDEICHLPAATPIRCRSGPSVEPVPAVLAVTAEAQLHYCCTLLATPTTSPVALLASLSIHTYSYIATWTCTQLTRLHRLDAFHSRSASSAAASSLYRPPHRLLIRSGKAAPTHAPA